MPSTLPTFQKSFVEQILGKAVTRYQVLPGANAGDNVMGNMVSIVAEAEDGSRIQAIYKGMPPSDTPLFDFAIKAKLFRVENAIYRDVAPRVRALLGDERGSASAVLPIPHCYATMNDDVGDYLVLEDLRPLGYSMPDKRTGLTLPETLLATRTLARLHAVTHHLIREEGERLFEEDGLRLLRDHYFRREGSEFEKTGLVMIRANVQNTVALLEENGRQTAALKLRDLLADEHRLRRIMGSTHRDADRVSFPCVIHGDFWVNNLMYRYDGGDREKPIDLKLIDFQQAHRGNFLEDLGYFLLTSTTTRFRTEHLARTLFAYHDAFVEELRALGCPVPIPFTRGFLVDRFYEYLLPTYLFMSFAIPMQLCEPGDAPLAEVSPEAPSPSVLPPGWKPDSLDPDLFAMILQAQYLLQQMRKSPVALQRLLDLTDEMMALGIL